MFKRMFALAAIPVIAVVLYGGTAGATRPAPEHKVTICHATPPDTAANGWHAITVDVASVGYQHSGHQDQHDADIIPPYSYDDYSYPGKGDQSILANGCKPVTPPPDPTCETDPSLCPPPVEPPVEPPVVEPPVPTTPVPAPPVELLPPTTVVASPPPELAHTGSGPILGALAVAMLMVGGVLFGSTRQP